MTSAENYADVIAGPLRQGLLEEDRVVLAIMFRLVALALRSPADAARIIEDVAGKLGAP